MKNVQSILKIFFFIQSVQCHIIWQKRWGFPSLKLARDKKKTYEQVYEQVILCGKCPNTEFFLVHKVTIKNANFFVIIVSCLRTHQRKNFTFLHYNFTFFWSVFSRFRTEYEDLRSKSPYSVQIREKTDQIKLCIWNFFSQCIQSHCFSTCCPLDTRRRCNECKKLGRRPGHLLKTQFRFCV